MFDIPRDVVRDLPALASVRTIYIDDLTHDENLHLVEGSDLVKEKIRQTLTKVAGQNDPATPLRNLARIVPEQGWQ